jgi:hypothetical protein
MASDERDGGANGAAEEEVQYNAQGKKKQKHDKPKPWDHDGIDHWNIVKIAPEDNPSGLLEESSFATLFPQYRGMDETFPSCYNIEAMTEEILESSKSSPTGSTGVYPAAFAWPGGHEL